MARPLVPRRHIAFKWPLDLHARIRDEINTRGVSFAAFVYRACELYLETLKSERSVVEPAIASTTTNSTLGLARLAPPQVKFARAPSLDEGPPSAVFERFRQR